MPASVSQLRKPVGDFAAALEAYRAARFRDCLSELGGLESSAASFLRARTHLRLGDVGSANLALNATPASHAERAEEAMLRGVIETRLEPKDGTGSLNSFAAARAYAISANDGPLESEIDYYLALREFRDDRLAAARLACSKGLNTLGVTSARGDVRSRLVPAAHVEARLYEFIGLIDLAQNKTSEHLTRSRQAYAALERCSVSDAFQEAHVLWNLVVGARDLDDAREAALVADRVETFPWVQELVRWHFRLQSELGSIAALHGNVVEAFGRFRKAANLGSDVIQEIEIGVQRATLLYATGSSAEIVESELGHAFALFESFDWSRTDAWNRGILVPLAQALAYGRPPDRARAVLDCYEATHNAPKTLVTATSMELRVVAEEAFTDGLILRAEDKRDAAAKQLALAFELWKDIGFEWRASRAALELAELDARGDYRATIVRELQARPKSFYADRARRLLAA